MTMSPSLRPLGPGFAAEVVGLDLDNPIGAATSAWLRQALAAHLLLLIRDQPLHTDQQFNLALAFGPIDERVPSKALASVGMARRKAHYVSNTRPDGALPYGELCFHNDQLFYETPNRAATLHAIEVPSKGGETIYVDLAQTFEAFPEALRARLEHLTAFQVFDYDARENGTPRIPLGQVRDDVARWCHPAIVRTQSGRRVPWIARNHSIRLMEVDESESSDLLDETCDRIASSHFRHVHAWRPGDTLIWDNWATQHARTDFDPGERRSLRRIPILHLHEGGKGALST